jgi:hypothetical protein
MEAAHGCRVKAALADAYLSDDPGLVEQRADIRAQPGNIGACSLLMWRLPFYAVLRDRPTAANQL